MDSKYGKSSHMGKFAFEKTVWIKCKYVFGSYGFFSVFLRTVLIKMCNTNADDSF